MNAFNYCLLNDILLKQPAKEYSDAVNQGFATFATLRTMFETCQCTQGDIGFKNKLRGIYISRERPSASQYLLCSQRAVLTTNISKYCTQTIFSQPAFFFFPSRTQTDMKPASVGQVLTAFRSGLAACNSYSAPALLFQLEQKTSVQIYLAAPRPFQTPQNAVQAHFDWAGTSCTRAVHQVFARTHGG